MCCSRRSPGRYNPKTSQRPTRMWRNEKVTTALHAADVVANKAHALGGRIHHRVGCKWLKRAEFLVNFLASRVKTSQPACLRFLGKVTSLHTRPITRIAIIPS